MTQIFWEDEINQLFEDLQPGEPYRHWYPNGWARKLGEKSPLLRFRVWLAETAVWCNKLADLENPETCFRREGTQPYIFNKNRFEIIWNVHSNRRWSLESELKYLTGMPYDLISQGQLLVYYPELNLSDGAARLASNGYFDNYNTPPWDTWVDYFEEPQIEEGNIWKRSKENYLISWVHPDFIDLVQEGIRVNPEECIVWLEDSDTLFKDIWFSIASLREDG